MNGDTELGAQIRIIRKARGFTQAVLAEIVGIETKSLGRIEKGLYYPSIPTLRKLASALDVSVGAFFPNKTNELDIPLSLSDLRVYVIEKMCSADEGTLFRLYKQLSDDMTYIQ